MNSVDCSESKYSPSPDVLKLLALSEEESESIHMRPLNCPICHFYMMDVQEGQQGFVKAKCRKCKSERTLNLAYFRRQKQHSSLRLTEKRHYTR